jgi:hypothetical protein
MRKNAIFELVPEVRIELTTYPLPRGCATTTLLRHPCPKPMVWGERTAAIPKPRPKGKVENPPMSPKDSAAQQRLAKALRENLKRRKAAQRGRMAADAHDGSKSREDRPTKAQKDA